YASDHSGPLDHDLNIDFTIGGLGDSEAYPDNIIFKNGITKVVHRLCPHVTSASLYNKEQKGYDKMSGSNAILLCATTNLFVRTPVFGADWSKFYLYKKYLKENDNKNNCIFDIQKHDTP
ncbi:hypothetical protein ACJX0J_011995, partial [Zea mays]